MSWSLSRKALSAAMDSAEACTKRAAADHRLAEKFSQRNTTTTRRNIKDEEKRRKVGGMRE